MNGFVKRDDTNPVDCKKQTYCCRRNHKHRNNDAGARAQSWRPNNANHPRQCGEGFRYPVVQRFALGRDDSLSNAIDRSRFANQRTNQNECAKEKHRPNQTADLIWCNGRVVGCAHNEKIQQCKSADRTGPSRPHLGCSRNAAANAPRKPGQKDAVAERHESDCKRWNF